MIDLAPIDRAGLAPRWTAAPWLNSAPLELAELRGRVVVLHAFQMLCPGCVMHGLPQAARIHANFDRRDVIVVGLHTVFEHHSAMGPQALEAFVHEYRVPFPVGVDCPGDSTVPTTMAAYEMRGTPTLVLIDRHGRRRAQIFGRPEDLELGAAVQALVAESDRPRPASDCDEQGCLIEAAGPDRVGALRAQPSRPLEPVSTEVIGTG
ncbi:MAG: TlpA family protein disulfide reductase [Deltaproteobacteria bacterium]|nr:TlpA family protein disulfide reductase [Deltaproteobacteria bacterium]